VPDVPYQPVQLIDVRDLARWIVDAGEQGLSGTFNAAPPARPLPGMLEEVRDATGAPGTELVPVAPHLLSKLKVATWGAGPRSLPQWMPADCYGVLAHDVSASLAAGLTARPAGEIALDILAQERARGTARPRTSGLSAEAEAEVLAAWRSARR
jgi:2'-hydroxyisoflavone reductase